MELKNLIVVLALIIAGIAGWFFQQQGDVAPPVSMAPTDVDYEATEKIQIKDSFIQMTTPRA